MERRDDAVAPTRSFSASDGDRRDFQREYRAAQDVHEFDPAMINLAAEVSRHASRRGSRRPEALLVLVLASMLEQRQGSTRLPLDAEFWRHGSSTSSATSKPTPWSSEPLALDDRRCPI